MCNEWFQLSDHDSSFHTSSVTIILLLYLLLIVVFLIYIFLLTEKENGPRTVKDVKLISAGRILENNRTVGECRSPLCDVPGGVTTMHVVVQPPPAEKGIA